ncbi:MAG: AsmA family protein [Terracidiphilus sp.]
MTDDGQQRRNKRRLVWTAAFCALLLAGLLAPPWISISRYQSRITKLVSASLGRPVRLSSVEMRLLPRPGFVLTDLTVDEDPAFGAEPVLHANTVTAAIRLLSLWRGRLEISTISVDEASLNLVRTSAGHWNLEGLFRNAAQSHGAGQGKAVSLPYLEATGSRVNIKNGLEKLPYSLLDADLTLSQSRPGEWHVSLRGQPARTDVSLDLADTGIVEMEADLHQAAELHNMPIHLAMEWRDAQLGQLSRLLVGSDPGWRGDLRGNLQLDGTAGAANVKTRLRATGVHRAEFAPPAPLDFDANCSFVYHYSARSMEQLACDSPLGAGRVHLTGALPANRAPQLHVELQSIPVQAGLDMLRTMRSGIDGTLQAAGTVSGDLLYDVTAEPTTAAPPAAAHTQAKRGARKHVAPEPSTALTGGLTVQGFKLTGDPLKQPIEVDKAVLEPAAGEPAGLATELNLPSGGETPLVIGLRLTTDGYEATLRGPVSFARIKELASAVGAEQVAALDGLAGDAPVLDVLAVGTWLPGADMQVSAQPVASEQVSTPGKPRATEVRSDKLTGTVTLHDANWKGRGLANPLTITQGTLHLGAEALTWDPVAFVYGPVKGTGSLRVPAACEPAERCVPALYLQFAELDAETLQAALLGARKPGTVLTELIDRFSAASATQWPLLDVTLDASALTLGPVKLEKASARLHVSAAGAELTTLDAGLLGGNLHATGKVTPGDKPGYALEGSLDRADAEAVCQLVGLRCAGGPFAAHGTVELDGFSGADLARSAKGSLHFEWRRGAVATTANAQSPAQLKRFAQWTGDATIAQGTVTLGQNTVQQGAQSVSIAATVPLTEPTRIHFVAPEEATAAKR